MDLAAFNPRRKSKFTDKLARHGFYKNNTLTEATVSKTRKVARDKKRIVVVSDVLCNIDNEIEYMAKLQDRIGNLQAKLSYELKLRNSALKVQSWCV